VGGLPLFLPLERLPVFQHLAGARDLAVAENVGVAEDQLLADVVGHIVQGEAAGLFLHAGVEDDLEQHVPKLFPQVLRVVLVDGLDRLVSLLQEIAADALMGLLGVPGAAAGRAQDADDILQVLDAVGVFVLKIYHTFVPSASYFSVFTT